MLSHLYHTLKHFRKAFSRERTWLVFCAIILGFLGATEMRGVTSICRYWLSDHRGYHRLLHFFRSDAYRLERLRACWHRWALAQIPAVEQAQRLVLLGDHTWVVKDGGRMPGVLTARETSETQSKPAYFRGQCWGALGLLVGRFNACFCLPLSLQMHQGFKHVGQEKAKLTMGQRMVQMALDFSVNNERSSWLVLDAFFGAAPVFQLANSCWSTTTQQPFVHVITRAKKSYVAYAPPPARKPGQRGRTRKYGQKITLWKAFDDEPLFQEVSMEIYAKQETVRLRSAKLLWRPLGQYLQFVWAITSHGPIVLMCSDLEANAEQILALYCRRVRIETLFNTLKNVIGAFEFHFWSQSLPRHSRKPFSNRNLKTPQPEAIPVVKDCWEAMERFVLCASIATGLLQWFSLQYQQGLWKQHILYLRTRSRELPSENTVRQILAPLLARELMRSRQNTLWGKIRSALSTEDEDTHHPIAKAA